MAENIRDDISYDDEAGPALRRRRRVMSDDGDTGPVIPDQEERDSRLEREMAERRAAGEALRVEVNSAGRNLSATFWGQAWNRNLMAYSHFESRMPRGRTAFRSGKVMDLSIEQGKVAALVAGARLFEVSIAIAPLDEEVWLSLQGKCQGRIAGLVELLSGELSDEVMALVCQPEQGLFPSPGEIRCSCSCPDYADLCQHAAAVLYATGSRLDDSPALLFTLRGVLPNALVAENPAGAIAHLTAPVPISESRAGALAGVDLSDIFGVELNDTDLL